jgi:hypothetical protein
MARNVGNSLDSETQQRQAAGRQGRRHTATRHADRADQLSVDKVEGFHISKLNQKSQIAFDKL